MFEYERSELTFYCCNRETETSGEVLPAAGHFQTQVVHNKGARENESYVAQYFTLFQIQWYW